MKITNEKDIFFGKYCGKKPGQTTVVTGKYALINFHSDASYEYKGFELYFTPVPGGKFI